MVKKLMLMVLCLSAVSVACAQDCAACAAAKKARAACAGKTLKGEGAFQAEAKRMQMKAEGKDECCQSTPLQPKAVGDPGCCNQKGAVAKFKVWNGKTFQYYTCADAAHTARKSLLARGMKAGKVQKVIGKVLLP